MRKRACWLALLLIISACGQPRISLPAIGEHQLLITHIKEPRLTVVDTATNQVIHQERFAYPVHCIEPVDERYAVLAGHQDQTLLLLDLDKGKIRKLRPDITTVIALFYDHQEQHLLIADRNQKEIAVFSMESEKVVDRIPLAHSPIALTVRDRYLYVLTDNEAEVAIVDLSRRTVVQTFPVLKRATDLVVVQDHIWIGGHGSNEELNEYVHVYDAASGELLQKIKVGLMPVALYTDSSHDEVWVISHGSDELHSIDKETFMVQSRIPTGNNPYYITADEQFIYVTALDGDQLTIVNRKEHTIYSELDLPSGPYGMIVGGHRLQ